MVEYAHFREPDEIPRAIIGARFAIGGTYEGPFHSHRKAQLFFATEGVITVDTLDGLRVTPPHRAVWIPSEVAHTVRGSGIRDINCIYVEPEQASRMPGNCSVIGVTPLLREMILRIVAVDEAGTKVRMDALLVALMEELANAPRDPGVLPMPTERRVRRVVEAMIRSPEERRSLAEWGAIVGASSRTLARLFQSETGVSFGQWRQQLDIAIAVQMLCSGTSVQQVSDRLGYETPSAFIAMFKRSMGRTPARYVQDITAAPTA